MTMPDRYALFGDPVAHSKSPQLQAELARQSGQDLRYEAIHAPDDGFPQALAFSRARRLDAAAIRSLKAEQATPQTHF